ncbi:MAG: PfkB family carbohydrate kinase, partial [Gemmataceae bacterium]
MRHAIITFGEAMLRLSPPNFQRLEAARMLDVHAGGAELNTAAGLVRMGWTAAWVSAIAENPLGQNLLQQVRAAGVSTEFVRQITGSRCGLYYLEEGAAPRPSVVEYDRANSAATTIDVGQFDWPAIFTGAKWFHVTGITPALGSTVAAATLEALIAAKTAAVPTSFDLNYRSKLWTPTAAAESLGTLLPYVDILIASMGDAEQIFGITGETYAEVAEQLIQKFGLAAVAGIVRQTPLVWRNTFGAVGYAGGQFY